tara:strand:+ start:78 stop:530 length:453 start_codon:yes stop_codon:yes gene_type:complete
MARTKAAALKGLGEMKSGKQPTNPEKIRKKRRFKGRWKKEVREEQAKTDTTSAKATMYLHIRRLIAEQGSGLRVSQNALKMIHAAAESVCTDYATICNNMALEVPCPRLSGPNKRVLRHVSRNAEQYGLYNNNGMVSRRAPPKADPTPEE